MFLLKCQGMPHAVYLAKAIGGQVENFEVGHHMDCVLIVRSDHAADQDRLN